MPEILSSITTAIAIGKQLIEVGETGRTGGDAQARRNNFRAGYCCFFIVIAAVWLLGAVGTGILVEKYIVH